MSPDDKRALVLYRGQLYLADVPLVGGEPPVINVNSPSASVVRLTSVGADESKWSNHGGQIFWTVGSSAFTLDVNAIYAAARAHPPAVDKTEETSSAEPKHNTPVFARLLHPAETRIAIEVP